MAAGLVLAVLISNICGFVRDGRTLENIRSSVLRLHILANSDSDEDQELKLMVRDALLESGIFSQAESLEEAENTARSSLPEIIDIAEQTLRNHGCTDSVSAEIEDIWFDERVYDDITMPAGEYRALRIEIGEAKGHNWWCVMYPPLCIPAASEVECSKDTEDGFFSEEERDVLNEPKKYRVRFAVWDKIKGIIGN